MKREWAYRSLPFFKERKFKMTKTYQSIRFTELHLTVYYTPKGEEKPVKANVDFIGGSTYPRQQNGTFMTSDKDLIKYLEESKGFNRDYRLLYKDGKQVFEETEEETLEDKLKAANKLNTILSQQISNFTNGEDNPLNETLEQLEATVEEQAETIVKLQREIDSLKRDTPEKKVKEEKPKEEKVTELKAPGIINMQAARQYLIKEHGQDIKEMKNGKEVLLVAEKLGVTFPDWHPKS